MFISDNTKEQLHQYCRNYSHTKHLYVEVRYHTINVTTGGLLTKTQEFNVGGSVVVSNGYNAHELTIIDVHMDNPTRLLNAVRHEVEQFISMYREPFFDFSEQRRRVEAWLAVDPKDEGLIQAKRCVYHLIACRSEIETQARRLSEVAYIVAARSLSGYSPAHTSGYDYCLKDLTKEYETQLTAWHDVHDVYLDVFAAKHKE